MKYIIILILSFFVTESFCQINEPVAPDDSIKVITTTTTVTTIKKKAVVQPPSNQSPTANAGADKAITLPTNTVSLSGSGIDPDGTISKYQWSGTDITFSSPTTAATNLAGLKEGIYTIRLTVTDNKNAVAFDDVVITVNPAVSGSVKYLQLPKGANRQYDNVTNVVIENLQFSNPTDHILRFNNSSNITIRNCYFAFSKEIAIVLYRSRNVLIEKCLFANSRTFVLAQECFENIKILNSQFINAKGPFERGQFIQFNGCNGPGYLVEGNRGENWDGESNNEDLVSQYNSFGTPSSPMTVRNNIFRGSGGTSISGGGIMAGDGGGGNQVIEGNKLVNTGWYGTGASGGTNIQIRNNMVYSVKRPQSGLGLFIANYSGKACGGVTMSGNRSNWTDRNGGINNFWSDGQCGAGQQPTTLTLSEMSVPSHLIDFITPAELLTIK